MGNIEQLATQTKAVVAAALDALSVRQQLIATNLANANTADYKILRVDFEQAMREAMRSAGSDAAARLENLDAFREALADGGHTRRSTVSAVDLEQEMVQLNDTVLRYNALIQGLGKYGSLTRMAISGEVKS